MFRGTIEAGNVEYESERGTVFPTRTGQSLAIVMPDPKKDSVIVEVE